MMQIFDIIGSVEKKNILLLQGPMGTYFNYLDKQFIRYGAKTYRIGLNFADQFFSNATHFTPFKGKREEWDRFVHNFFTTNSIDMLFVFGDCRYYQAIAVNQAKKLGIKVFVFEEGYIRPDFVTLEAEGANDNSKLPRERSFYDHLEYSNHSECHHKNITKIGSTYGAMALQAIIYYILADIFSFKYPNYQHHRKLSFVMEGFYGIRNFIRKNRYLFLEYGKENRYAGMLKKEYYFVPLQTFEDFQIKEHSKYNSIEEFLKEIIVSFSQFAPLDKYLVIKHHPMDRGKKNYKKFIQTIARKMECEEKIDIVFDVHLPTLLRNATATITVNSTVGISSLYHHTPTLCMGKAMYDIEGLTSKDVALNDFWTHYKPVDEELFNKFRCYLIQKTQLNDSFYI